MTLLTAHRILIGTATAFFVLYSLWEFSGGQGTGGAWGWARGVVSLLASAGLGAYFLGLRGARQPPRGGSAGPSGGPGRNR